MQIVKINFYINKWPAATCKSKGKTIPALLLCAVVMLALQCKSGLVNTSRFGIKYPKSLDYLMPVKSKTEKKL